MDKPTFVLARAKASLRAGFDGSDRLFRACYREYTGLITAGAIDYPRDKIDASGWLETLASGKVNNPRSVFYMYG
jgi:hypothetical protein